MKQHATMLAAFTGASLSKTWLCIFVRNILSFSMAARVPTAITALLPLGEKGEAPGFLLGIQDQAAENTCDTNQLKVPCQHCLCRPLHQHTAEIFTRL